MRTILTCSESVTDIQVLKEAVYASGFEITGTIILTIRGDNDVSRQLALELDLPRISYPLELMQKIQDESTDQMVQDADALIAVWDGSADATDYLIYKAKEAGKNVFVLDSRKPREESIDKEAIANFSVEMLAKLRQHSYKAGWQKMSNKKLFMLLCEEVNELSAELIAITTDDVERKQAAIRECADVANFAMMIADNLKGEIDGKRSHQP